MAASVRDSFGYLLRPAAVIGGGSLVRLRSDVVAGLGAALVLLPQAVAYGVAAGLPPAMGLYTATIGAIVAGLWGSSNHVLTSATNVVSLLVLSSLSAFFVPGSAEFLVAAGLTAVMVGVIQLVMGLARLGMLVNFISDSLIVGFAAGAGILLAINELRPLLGLTFTSRSVLETTQRLWLTLPQTSLLTLAVGVATIVILLLIRRLRPRWPATVICLSIVCLGVFAFGLNSAGVRVIGPLPQSLPPFHSLPILDLGLIAELAPGAMAIAAVGLIQTLAIARTIATGTGQQLDNNQEFVGQGLGNLACGFFSGYPASGSLAGSAVNLQAGARSSLAAVCCGVFILAGMFLLSPLGSYLPRAALSGILIVTGVGMVNRAKMAHIWRSSRGDAVIMLATLAATLTLRIDFAVLVGIVMSLAYYILQTSAPKVNPVVPDDAFRHFVHQPEKPECPQLGILDILGDLYFGAANNVEKAIRAHHNAHPTQRFLLLRMHSVQHCDITGIGALRNIVRSYHDRGGDVFLVRVNPSVLHLMKVSDFYDDLGADHFLSEDKAIEYLFYHVLDPAVCIYESDVRVFRECQNLPKYIPSVEITLPKNLAAIRVADIEPRLLWQQLRQGSPPLVIDVREPREFQQGHIPQAQLVSLPTLLAARPALPHDRSIVFVCRTGRRSTRAAQLYQQDGYTNVAVLQSGMQGWETARLLEAVE